MSQSSDQFHLADAIGALSRQRPGGDSSSTEPFTILLVDDDPDCRALIREAIGETGCKHVVVECGDGMAAIDYLKNKIETNGTRPGLIFLDVEMPRMNGLQTLEAIKSHELLRDIPVVMMTGVADDAYIQQAALLGANSYTIKPANPEQFLRTVMTSTQYWLTVHQYPGRHLPQKEARR
jgi:two-component system, response regulator